MGATCRRSLLRPLRAPTTGSGGVGLVSPMGGLRGRGGLGVGALGVLGAVGCRGGHRCGRGLSGVWSSVPPGLADGAGHRGRIRGSCLWSSCPGGDLTRSARLPRMEQRHPGELVVPASSLGIGCRRAHEGNGSQAEGGDTDGQDEVCVKEGAQRRGGLVLSAQHAHLEQPPARGPSGGCDGEPTRPDDHPEGDEPAGQGWAAAHLPDDGGQASHQK